MKAYNSIKIYVFVVLVHTIQCKSTDSAHRVITATSDNTTYRTSIGDQFDIIKLLKKSRGRFGFDYEIIKAIASKSEYQRQKLIKLCIRRYKKNLIKLLERRFIGDTSRAIKALLTPHKKLYATELRNSINSWGTDKHAISEILGTLNGSEIMNVAAIYKDEFNSSLKEDLIAGTSGSYQDLIIALCDNIRDENEKIDLKDAQFDAHSLYAASKGNDENANVKTFITILTSRSFPQLKVIFKMFKKNTNMTILEAIANRFEGDLQYGLSIIAKYVLLSKSDFYAGQLREATSGDMYDDSQLTRIIVGRSEIDLDAIKKSYNDMYRGAQLTEVIYHKTGGAYKHLLQILLNK